MAAPSRRPSTPIGRRIWRWPIGSAPAAGGGGRVTAPVLLPDDASVAARLVAVAAWEGAPLRYGVATLTAVASRLAVWRMRVDAVGRALETADCWSGPAAREAAAAVADVSAVAAVVHSALAGSQDDLERMAGAAAAAQELAVEALTLRAATPTGGSVVAFDRLSGVLQALVPGAAAPDPGPAVAVSLAAVEPPSGRVPPARRGRRWRASPSGAGSRRPRSTISPGGSSSSALCRRPPCRSLPNPAAVAAWWAGLSERDQRAVILSASAAVGALDGVPAWARDRANRLVLERALDDPGTPPTRPSPPGSSPPGSPPRRRPGGRSRCRPSTWPATGWSWRSGTWTPRTRSPSRAGHRQHTGDDLDSLVGERPGRRRGGAGGGARPGRHRGGLARLPDAHAGRRASASRPPPRAAGPRWTPRCDGLAAARAAAGPARRGRRSSRTATARWWSTRRPTARSAGGRCRRPAGQPGNAGTGRGLEAPEVYDAATPGDPVAWLGWFGGRTVGAGLRRDGAADRPVHGPLRLLRPEPADAGGHRARWSPAGGHPADPFAGGRFPPSGTAPHAQRCCRTARPRQAVLGRFGGRGLPWRAKGRSAAAPAAPGVPGPYDAGRTRRTRQHRTSDRSTVPTKTSADRKRDPRGDRGRHQGARPAAIGRVRGAPLVIVESPTKANKIAGYLGSGYVVEASVGHIRDLPRNAADVPAEHKGAAWARLGVDVDNSFEPLYVVSPDRRQQVSRLKQLVKDASEVYLATDEDREGEAIAWHLVDTLKPRVPVRRMVFHEITPEAIARAVANPRELDTALVDAQETRRILDRLYGYEVSPVLWKKVLPKLSAGRVQSVATRIVVERERERMAFHAADYWSLEGTFAVPKPAAATDEGEPTTVRARWSASTTAGSPPAATSTRRPAGSPATSSTSTRPAPAGWPPGSRAARSPSAGSTRSPTAAVRTRRSPPPRCRWTPAASSAGRRRRRCGWRSGCTRTATSPTCVPTRRTSPTRRSTPRGSRPASCTATRTCPAEARRYKSKAKGAQEAHEAIRPAGDSFRTPGQLAAQLGRDEFRLYELVWQRTVASQMADAVGQTVSIRLAGRSATDEAVEFTASGRTITFPGFLKAYVESRDESGPAGGDDEPAATTPSAGCPASSAASSSTPASWTPRATPRPRRRATPSRAWWPGWRSSASAGRRPTPRSCRRSRTAGTSGRRATRWCPPSSRSPW